MPNKPTALVIGADIGGITTAARLAKNGYDVTVLEKEFTPGGRCNQVIRDGHRFDIGPTLFLMPEIWEETFASLGEKMSDHLDLKHIDPTRTDKAAAPAGQETLYVLIPVGNLDARTKQDWDAMVNRARETIFNRLAKEMSATDLREHIKFEIVYQPKVWKERFNLEKGSAFGLSHNFMQVGFLRPQNRHKQYKNLYSAGASTHPGTGLPIVFLSARLTTEMILKESSTISVQKVNKPALNPV
jgi:phytoene dehydrogenase-like protein